MKTLDKATLSRIILKAYNLYSHISFTESIAARISAFRKNDSPTPKISPVNDIYYSKPFR